MRMLGRYQPSGRGAGWAAVLVTLVALLGSSQTEPTSQPAQSLQERVTAFWDARLKGDEVAAYQYEIYAYTGELTPTQYIQARSPMFTYKAYTIDDIQAQEQEALVTVNLQYQLSVPGMVDLPLAMELKERWVRLDDNQWYHNVRPKKSGTVARQQD